MPVHRVGLVVHQGRDAAREASSVVHAWCEAHEVPCTEIDVWSTDQHRRSAREEARAAGAPDLVVTLGGDGTFLRGARIAVKTGATVLGVDLGKVGFLTEAPACDITTALDAVHAGHAPVEERMTLTVRASRLPEVPAELESLLCYGRGPALPPPQARPESTAGDGWGLPLDVNALNDAGLCTRVSRLILWQVEVGWQRYVGADRRNRPLCDASPEAGPTAGSNRPGPKADCRDAGTAPDEGRCPAVRRRAICAACEPRR
ncbi:NAD(+)/NADH kinase [Streptomyces noursei]|uniref:NAD(+)/NADH kinase n=1 Tax=Streptomyces noursei TaxID=1971 RepID=UPI0030B83BB5